MTNVSATSLAAGLTGVSQEKLRENAALSSADSLQKDVSLHSFQMHSSIENHGKSVENNKQLSIALQYS